ncbi:MAG: zinc ribbon domain-containing protein [Clostridiales bacterium]|nr:zinc ribbon domain-containing protein [Clostridiales bacterium]
MVFFCPQCGTKISQGSASCPQCGAVLHFVIQKNADKNTASDEGMMTMARRRNVMFAHLGEQVMEGSQETVPVLKYNGDYINKNEKIADAEADMQLIGWVDEMADVLDAPVENPQAMEQNDNEKLVMPVQSTTAQSTADTAKYKIITQIYDKKVGFNAVELETKLNMYAKLGYQIVPNTMICQPGQDFFVLLEKVPAEKKLAEKEKAEKEKAEKEKADKEKADKEKTDKHDEKNAAESKPEAPVVE